MDLKTEGDVQNVVEKITERVNELRGWLKANRNQKIQITKTEVLDADDDLCRVQTAGVKVFKLRNCSTGIKKTTANLDLADFEQLRQYVAMTQVELALLTTFSLDGLHKNGIQVADAAPGKRRYESVDSIKGIGQIRNKKFMQLLPETTTEFVTAWKAAQKHYKTLCPAGELKPNSRPGKAFDHGICAKSEGNFDQILDTVKLLVSGQVMPVMWNTSHGEVKAIMNYSNFLNTPARDIREFGPAKFNRCGEVIEVGDGKVGGLFPTGDLNDILKEENSKSKCK